MFLTPAIHKNLIILLVCCLFATACSDSGPGKSKKKRAEHLVETVQASIQNISASRTLPGTLQAVREVNITTRAEGLLLSLAVYPGDQVSAGQILAQLDDTLVKSEVEKARATLKQATVDLRRLEDLAPRKLASESEIAQAQTRKEIAASELQLKQTELEHTRITSPIDGVISARMAEPGNVVPVYTQLLTLIDTSSLKAEIYLSELLLPLIKTGNPVDIRIDALGKQTFMGKITRIYPSIDRNTRRGTIEVMLNPVPQGALAGQLCRVTIHTQNRPRLMIPYDTVRHDKQGAYVFTLHNDQARRINITTGLQQDQMIEVVEGLSDQQEIISKGFFGLKDQMKVKRANLQITDEGPVETNE